MKCLSRLAEHCQPIPQRYVLVLLLATAISMMFLLRLSFGLALTQMAFIEADEDYEDNDEGIDEDQECYSEEISPNEHNVTEFDWNVHDKHLLLSSYFYGYSLSSFVSGILSVMYGGKVVIISGLLISGIDSLLTPFCARKSYWLLFFMRIIMGMSHGVVIPGITEMVAKWSPPNERSRIVGFIYSGIVIGSVGGIGLSGYILGSLNSWDPLFYIFGSVVLLWCVVFYLFGYDCPENHPFVTDKEMRLVKETIWTISTQRPHMIPWFQICTSLPVIVLILVNFAHGWLMLLVTVELPLYFKYVLKYNIKATGSRLSLPFVSMLVSNFFAAIFSDWTITHNFLSVTTNRIIFGILSNILPIPFLTGVPYVGCDKNDATILLTFIMFFKGLAYPSIKVNHLDLSPNYAAILIGISNALVGLGGLCIPSLIEQFVIEDEATISDWRKMFLFSSGILLLCTLPYGFFASGDVQVWNNESEEDLED